MRAFTYLRLSVDEEAGRAQSIDAQRYEIKRYAEANGITIVDEFIDSGVSGQKASRPQFDIMMRLACAKPAQVNAVLVYRLDRFARNQRVFHNSFADLHAASVQLISISEHFGHGRLARTGMSYSAIQAEGQAIAASIHTSKNRRANARCGNWNGGPIPYGYETFEAEINGDKARMQLRIVEAEADVVREIFDWAEAGRGGRWICKTLNDLGVSIRGRKWSNSNLAGVLAREHYTGTYYDRTMDDEGRPPKPEDWIAVPCPQIISEAQFQRVGALRASRNPRKTAPHIAAGTTLLVGIARCGNPSCDCAMTIRTGKGGRYSYYTCANKVNRSAQCSTPSVPRDKLDAIVLETLEKRILEPARLQALLADVLDTSDEQRARREKECAAAKAEHTRCGTAITRLLQLIEQGLMDGRDPAFAERLAENKAAQAAAMTRVKTLEAQLAKGTRKITPLAIANFGKLISEKLRDDDRTLRSSYVRMFVSKVSVSNKRIVITGPRTALEDGLADGNPRPNAMVPSFDREWCPRPDSNRHSFQNRILNPARLPIPPLGQRGMPLVKAVRRCKAILISLTRVPASSPLPCHKGP